MITPNYIPNSNKIDIEPIFGGLAIGKLLWVFP